MPRAIVLIGMMGSGKTEVGRRVAERLGCSFCDLDAVVEAGAGRSVAEIFAAEGEPAFRQREAAAVAEVTSAVRGDGASRTVISGGGGVVLDPANVAALREAGTVVWLQVAPAVAAARLGGAEGRPVLSATEGPTQPAMEGPTQPALEARIAALLAEREPAYESAADHSVDANGPLEEVAAAVLALAAP